MNERMLLESFAALSVNVNGLIVPGRSIEQVLARHALNLVVMNDCETFKVSLFGSATAVKFLDRFILLCTGHQLKGVDPKRVSMLKDDGSVLVTSGGVRHYQPSLDTDAYDIVAFDFTEPVAAHPDLKKRFFDLQEVPPEAPGSNVTAVLLAGYPSKEQLYDLGDNNRLGLTRRHVVCLPERRQPSDPVLLQLRVETPLSSSPDGMSGGSAFVILSSARELRAFFAGIVVRGGTHNFYVLKSGYVMAFLRGVFDSTGR